MEMYVLITKVFVELDLAGLKDCTQVNSDQLSTAITSCLN